MATSNIISRVSLLLISLVLLLSIAGCKGDAELLEDLTDEITFFNDSCRGSEWFACLDGIYPVDLYINKRCKENLHYSPVWVWTIFLNDNLLEEIVHERKTRNESGPAYESLFLSYSWPHWDYINYEFTSEGTYTIRTDLYDPDEYRAMNILAPRRGTFTQTVHCGQLEAIISAKSTGEPREYAIQCWITNPKYMPDIGWNARLCIINNDTGIQEKLLGMMDEEARIDNDVYWYTYQFQTEADYRLIFTIDYIDRGGPVLIEEGLLSEIMTEPEISIELPQQPLLVGQEYTFRVVTEGVPLEAPSYEWDFGDKNGKIVPLSNEATHLYDEAGTYSVSVQIFDSDREGTPLLGDATAEVIVEEEEETVDALSFLQQTTYLLISVRGDTTYHISDGRNGPREGTVLNFYSNQPSTSWDGTHFSHRYYNPPTASSGGITVTIEGDVSEEADEILNLTATVIYDDSHVQDGEQRESRISIRNVEIEPEYPIPATSNPSYEPHFIVYIEGSEVATYVTDTFYEHMQPTTSDPDFKTWYDPLEFVDTERTPFLRIEFGTSDLY